MKRHFLLILSVAFIFTSCGDGRKASALLKQAEQAYSAAEYSTAKQLIDSIRTTYPKAFDARKKGVKLMQHVELDEQKTTIIYLDSLMVVRQAQLDSIVGNYVLEKDTAYQEIGNYFWPTQVVEKNIGRSFLRAHVNELGEMSLTSIYSGSGNIHHTSVKVTVDGDTYAETPLSTDSYESSDLGQVIEKADYKLSEASDVVAFIVANRDAKSIRLEFKGDKSYKTTMHPDDVKAICGIYSLTQILSSMEQIRNDKKEAQLKIQFVTRKMQEGEE